MTIDIKGIQFNIHELEEVSIDSLETGTLSTAHVFYLTSSKKPFLLLRAGEIITGAFISKYKNKGLENVSILKVTDLGLIQKYTSLLSSIFSKTHYYDQLAFKDEFLKEFYEDFLNPEKAYSLMNFVYPAFRVMNKIPIEQYLKIQEESVELHYRALLVAALSIPSSLLNGLYDPHTIQDLYQSAIYLDMGLVNGNHTSYLTLKACELERNTPGEGYNFLQGNSKGSVDASAFFEHPQASYDFATENLEYFHNPECIEAILYHHEKQDGTGFPRGIFYSSISSWETVLIFTDYLVPFAEHTFSKVDSHKAIVTWLKDLDSNPQTSRLPVKNLMTLWKSYLHWMNPSIVGKEVIPKETDEENVA
jgi:hypothetical protein